MAGKARAAAAPPLPSLWGEGRGGATAPMFWCRCDQQGLKLVWQNIHSHDFSKDGTIRITLGKVMLLIALPLHICLLLHYDNSITGDCEECRAVLLLKFKFDIPVVM